MILVLVSIYGGYLSAGVVSTQSAVRLGNLLSGRWKLIVVCDSVPQRCWFVICCITSRKKQPINLPLFRPRDNHYWYPSSASRG
jgi:hypothetical protein